jgi:probable HAF family extracellular repeat protein
VPTDLGNMGGGAWNTPVAINNHGQVVGFANTSGDENAAPSPSAFIWTKATGMQELPALGEDSNAIAFDINEKGQVVGQSAGATLRAFLYQDGIILDLNALVQPDSSLYLTLAQGINNRGEIAGTALDTVTGQTVAFLAVPSYGGESEANSSKAAEREQLQQSQTFHQSTTTTDGIQPPRIWGRGKMTTGKDGQPSCLGTKVGKSWWYVDETSNSSLR